MKELLRIIARNLVDSPNEVEVIEETKDNIVTLTLKVGADDVGKVIGKQGRIARAIRTVIKASAINTKQRVNVEIV